MGEEDVRVAAGRVLAALREAGRSEGTIRRYQVVLDRFTAFLDGRGLSAAGDQVCVDFIARQTGTRLGEPVDLVKDGCPARFRPLREEYVASCRGRGNPTEPAGPQLKTLPDLTAYAQAHGLTLTPRPQPLTPSNEALPKSAC